MKIESINHLALLVKDAERSVEFYRRYCGMEVVHARKEGDLNVRWIRLPHQKQGFMLVLLESLGDLSQEPGNVDHIGLFVESRKDVDEIVRLARSEGILIEGPVYAGPVIGYYCMVHDPDGNLIEFSCEQTRV